jgi:hypothetical protein
MTEFGPSSKQSCRESMVSECQSKKVNLFKMTLKGDQETKVNPLPHRRLIFPLLALAFPTPE